MNDHWKIFCLILRQLLLDWPVAFLDRMTFRKVLIIAGLLAITLALIHMGMPDASLFTIDVTTYDIGIAILLGTARGHVRSLLQLSVQRLRDLATRLRHSFRRIRPRAMARALRLQVRNLLVLKPSDDEDGALYACA